MPTGRADLTAAFGSDGRLYAFGGSAGLSEVGTVEAYAPATNSWSKVTDMPTARAFAAAVLGTDGRIYVMGGGIFPLNAPPTDYATVEAYTPSTGTWAAATSMSNARNGPAASLGPDGRIYAIDGSTSGGVYDSVEAFSPGTNLWSGVAKTPSNYFEARAALGADGRIYVVADGATAAYSASSNAWTTLTPMSTDRTYFGVAASSVDGRIYVIGGYDPQNAKLATVEAYVP
jgi:N-acetylneuraminic acid mutarotase